MLFSNHGILYVHYVCTPYIWTIIVERRWNRDPNAKADEDADANQLICRRICSIVGRPSGICPYDVCAIAMCIPSRYPSISPPRTTTRLQTPLSQVCTVCSIQYIPILSYVQYPMCAGACTPSVYVCTPSVSSVCMYVLQFSHPSYRCISVECIYIPLFTTYLEPKTPWTPTDRWIDSIGFELMRTCGAMRFDAMRCDSK